MKLKGLHNDQAHLSYMQKKGNNPEIKKGLGEHRCKAERGKMKMRERSGLLMVQHKRA